jgi:predicted amidohydrolase YtcJ
MSGEWLPAAPKSSGTLGPGHGIDRAIAIELCTVGAARLDREERRRGTLTPGSLADIVAYPEDPFTAPVDKLPDLTPIFTMINGAVAHNPDGRL